MQKTTTTSAREEGSKKQNSRDKWMKQQHGIYPVSVAERKSVVRQALSGLTSLKLLGKMGNKSVIQLFTFTSHSNSVQCSFTGYTL